MDHPAQPDNRQHVWRIDLSCPRALAPASADPAWLRNAKAACRSALASGIGGARSPAPKRRTPAKSRRRDVVANPYQARSAPELRAARWTQEKLLRQGYSLHPFQRAGLLPWRSKEKQDERARSIQAGDSANFLGAQSHRLATVQFSAWTQWDHTAYQRGQYAGFPRAEAERIVAEGKGIIVDGSAAREPIPRAKRMFGGG